MTSEHPYSWFPHLVRHHFAPLAAAHGLEGPELVDRGWQHLELIYRGRDVAIRVLLENDADVFVYVDFRDPANGIETVLAELVAWRHDPSWQAPRHAVYEHDRPALDRVIASYASALSQYGDDVFSGAQVALSELARSQRSGLADRGIDDWEKFVRTVEEETANSVAEYLRALVGRAALAATHEQDVDTRLAGLDARFDAATVVARTPPTVEFDRRWIRLPARMSDDLRSRFLARGWTAAR